MTKKYRWVLRDGVPDEVTQRLQRELNNLPRALARALALRGVHTYDAARHYFRAGLGDLHDPFLMQDMEAAAARVHEAIERGERVLVYGDYDVDGTTSTALMTLFLRSQGLAVDYFIPDRIEDGYGLGQTGIDYAAAQGASLIIALDCGVTAHAEAAYARSKGLDLIICDHHTPHDTVPDAVAVLDPKRADCSYPFKELSGCGVGFKLVQAVLARRGAPPEEAFEYLDLVAVSIASDIVPLYGENRVLMRAGLERLQAGPRLGIRKLAERARLDLNACTTDRIVFTIGPRINAAGRMGDASRAAALLMATDPAEADALVEQLEEANLRRRELDQATQAEAGRQAELHLKGSLRHALVLHQDDWHPGVIGIVASRIVERFYRPTIMLCTVGERVKGSARSVSGVNIYEALTQCADLLHEFGGHDYAAGLSLAAANVPAFRDRLDAVVGQMVAGAPDLLLPAIEIDAAVRLAEVDERFWAVLRQFEPFGPDNDQPVFQAEHLEVVGLPRTVGPEGRHLKFQVRHAADFASPSMDVIGFGMGDYLALLERSRRQGQPLDLLFSLQENVYRGQRNLQLKARDLRLAEASHEAT